MEVIYQRKKGRNPLKYHIVTFGCQMNEADSERIASVLDKKGYEPAENMGGADLVVVNMCSVRQSAVDRVFGIGEKLKKLKTLPTGRQVKTILTGCILKKDRKKLAKKFDEISEFYNLLKRVAKRADLTKSYIPISSGCNNACTYCAVPLTRGKLICRDHKEILKEVKNAIKTGASEIWLLGQNVNEYQSPADKSINFAKILKQTAELPGNFQIRFMSPNPKNFSNEIIDVMASCKKVAKFLNLPFQSGDDKILKKMHRFYTVKEYKTLANKIREKIPDINLTTDVIVGFPGETKKQFENTLKLFKKIKFNLAYISKYSVRPGTAAAKFKDNVPLEEKKRREKALRKVLNMK